MRDQSHGEFALRMLFSVGLGLSWAPNKALTGRSLLNRSPEMAVVFESPQESASPGVRA